MLAEIRMKIKNMFGGWAIGDITKQAVAGGALFEKSWGNTSYELVHQHSLEHASICEARVGIKLF